MILLGKIRWKACIAAAGVVLVVLALALEPFAQQILSFPLERVNDTSVSPRIARAQAYDSGPSETAGNGQGLPGDKASRKLGVTVLCLHVLFLTLGQKALSTHSKTRC